MKILFFGDSITDAGRKREELTGDIQELGAGYVRVIGERFAKERPDDTVINKGISGNRVVDLYARAKPDVWNLQPDALSILIGINDVWHDIDRQCGVELDRFEKVYRMLIEETKERLPNTKIILVEPFVLRAGATKETAEQPDRFKRFEQVYEYAKVVKSLADEYGLAFVALQEKLTAGASKDGAEAYLGDGVHPSEGGAKLIAEEWMKVFATKW